FFFYEILFSFFPLLFMMAPGCPFGCYVNAFYCAMRSPLLSAGRKSADLALR
ncbi:hypothetical protein BDV26DRAFT_252741, partial [Aspergillus bertholletiae]